MNRIIVACLLPSYGIYRFRWRVFDADGISPTITARGGGNNEPKVLIEWD